MVFSASSRRFVQAHHDTDVYIGRVRDDQFFLLGLRWLALCRSHSDHL